MFINKIIMDCTRFKNQLILSPLKTLFLCSLSLFVVGCSSVPRYSKIPFIWSSEYRIPPTQRIIVVNKTPPQTLKKIKYWLEKEGGDIVSVNDKYQYSYQLAPQAIQQFDKSRKILKKEWQAYTDDVKRERPKGELQQVEALTDSQIQRIENGLSNYVIKANIRKRFRVRTYGVPDGTRTVMNYNPGVPGIYAGYLYSYQTVKYKTVSENIYFHSILNIYVFTKQGKTYVYAVGYPVIDKTSTRAATGKTTVHSNWPYVDGSHEAKAIQHLFKYLTTGQYVASPEAKVINSTILTYKRARRSSPAYIATTKAVEEASAEREVLENEENISKSVDEGLLSSMGAEEFKKGNDALALKLLARAKAISKTGWWENNFPYLVGAYFNTKKIKTAKYLLKNMSRSMKTLKTLKGNELLWFIESMEEAKSKTAKQFHALWNKAIKRVKAKR